MNSPSQSNADPAGPAAPVIKLIGLGDAGVNLLVLLKDMPGINALGANTDAASNGRQTGVQPITFGRKTSRGMSAGGDPERGQRAAVEDEAKFASACAGATVVLLTAGMGGGTGTGAAPVVARAARRQGALVLAFVVTPFGFEGAHREKVARAGVEALKAEADLVIVLPNERMLALVDNAASLEEGFAAINRHLAEAIRGILNLLTLRGPMPLDFAALATSLRGRHGNCAVACASVAGADRAKQLVSAALLSPMLGGESALKDAGAVVVSLAAGSALPLGEVRSVMEDINRLCGQAQVTFGAVIDPAIGEALTLTLIAAMPAEPGSPAVEPPGAKPPAARRNAPAIENSFLHKPEAPARTRSRLVPPPPELTPEKQDELMAQQGRPSGRRRRRQDLQQQLPLEIVSKGRFEKSEPTLHRGEDLDVPTFIRRGIVLN